MDNADASRSGVSPLDTFAGNITRAPVPLLYRVGMAVVAGGMIILPLIYVALVGLAGYGVVWYATHQWAMFRGSNPLIGRVLLYFGPLIVGGILVFFLIKPLFARQVQSSKPYSLSREREPLLFAFIEKVCRLVGAPLPSRVDLDCQVNASASFRRGVLSFLRHDVVLTIGVPLVAGMNMRQFAGVLAHEFGHFAQGAGMRLTYLIRSINGWFARVVYDRDSWDMALETWSHDADGWMAIVPMLAKFGVWVSRWVLWTLMMAGHAMSCFLLRQMEYDADRYEVKVAGSDAFVSTMERLHRLGAATPGAYEALAESYRSRRQLPDNIALYLVRAGEQLSTEKRAEVEKTLAEGKTKWMETHPSERDRIEAARRESEPGVFQIESPAAELFRDFEGTARAMTQLHYREDLSLSLTEKNLVSVRDNPRDFTFDPAEGEKAIWRFCFGLPVRLRPWTVGQEDLNRSREESLAIIDRVPERLKSVQPAIECAAKTLAEAEERLMNATAAVALLEAGFSISAQAFDLQSATVEAARQARDAAWVEQARLAAELAPWESEVRQRLGASLSLLETATGLERFQSELADYLPVSEALAQALPVLQGLRTEVGSLHVLLCNQANAGNRLLLDQVMGKLAAKIEAGLDRLRPALEVSRYPFPHAAGEMTLLGFVLADQPKAAGHERTFREGQAHLERLSALHYQIMVRFVTIAEAVESSVKVTSIAALSPESRAA